MKKTLFTMAALALLSSCQNDVDEALVEPASDLVEVSLGMVGEFTAEDAMLTRASHNFEYYVAISAEAASAGKISSGYVGRFTSLTDATVALKKGTTYSFYISAFESAGTTADLSTLCATQGEFVEVSSTTPYAPDFADTKVDRYYGSTSQEIVSNTTVSVSGKRFAYGINVNIETPLEGKVVMSSESPAFTYTVTSNDEAKVENNIFCLGGIDENASKETSVTVKWYDASNNEISSADKTLTIARNHMRTLKVKALDPKAGLDFTLGEEDMEDDGEEEITGGSGSNNGPFNGHDYVDLGLKDSEGRTIYWATCNVGAESPEDYGDYFAWGETEPYYQAGHSLDNPCSSWKSGRTGYNYASYKWCNGTSSTMVKYCTNSNYGTVDNKTVLDPEDDAAHVNWGGNWRMPTMEELDQLRTSCTWVWSNTKRGHTVTGTNGNSIFLPAAGRRGNSELDSVCVNGYYWSSSLYSSDTRYGNILCTDDSAMYPSKDSRCLGFPVRAVCVSVE